MSQQTIGPRRYNALTISSLLWCALAGCEQEPAPPADPPVPIAAASDDAADKATPDVSDPAVPIAVEGPVGWDHDSNLFDNGSFEEGREPWFALTGVERPYWQDFEVSHEQSRSGKRSAVFRVHSRGEIHRGTRIWGVIRDLELEKIPKQVSGWYRIEDWQRGALNQYLQVVICVFDPAVREFPELGGSPVQLAYVLAGIDAPPFQIRNRRFIFAGPKEPKTDEWVEFAFDIHAGFQEQWGRVPSDFGKVRIFFEARFDDPQPAEDLGATVFFDDLYLGGGM